jgi:isoquinoline 1-oxidoreductase subunit alpha
MLNAAIRTARSTGQVRRSRLPRWRWRPVAPAVAQALAAATGRRLDVMPFPDDAFRANEWEAEPDARDVNGAPAEFDGPKEVPLLWVVRELLRLTGSKFGCGIGACDSAAVRTCVMPVMMAQGRQVTTIEGSRAGNHPVQKAWTARCPAMRLLPEGMIMAAADLLRRHSAPSDGDIGRAMTNLCRCATYVRSAPPSTSPPSCDEVAPISCPGRGAARSAAPLIRDRPRRRA